MIISISASTIHAYSGNTELSPIEDGATVPLASVKLRKAFLTVSLKSYPARIKTANIQADRDYAKELEQEVVLMREQIAHLGKINRQSDRNLYLDYIKTFASDVD